MAKTIEEIAKISAEWWADKISNPKFDNGADSSTGMLTQMFASMAVKHINEDQKKSFIEWLANTIIDKFKCSKSIILSVDYNPCVMLAEAAAASCIDTSNFPWKTVMWITNDSISVRYGYGAEVKYLYSTKGYWQKKIDDLNSEIATCARGEYHCYIKDDKEREFAIEQSIALMAIDIEECKVTRDNTDD